MTTAEIKQKVEKGDIKTIGKILDMKPSNVWSRYLRNKTDVLLAAEQIIASREKLIQQATKNKK